RYYTAKIFSAFTDFIIRKIYFKKETEGMTFELGPTLLQGPEEPKLPKPLRHSPIHLAVSMTVSESLIKLRLTENCKEGSGLFMAPVVTARRRLSSTVPFLSHSVSNF
uniref:Uncharacterized protein n=1 Tax=Moschus moschiferus TaxID=68415 RepID=A0A8C6DHE5_MOSMO